MCLMSHSCTDDVGSVASSTSYLHSSNTTVIRQLAKRSIVKRKKQQQRQSRPNREKKGARGLRTRKGKGASAVKVTLDTALF